jgi:hypothetical protein
VKLSNKFKALILVVALVSLGVVVLSILESSDFEPKTKSAITQLSISKKLYHAPSQSNKVVAKTTNRSVATRPGSSYVSVVHTNNTLANTGPGNIVAIFCLTSVSGTIFAYLINVYRFNKPIRSE